MNGVEVVAVCAVIAALLVYAYLGWEYDHDMRVARRAHDRMVRESVRREEAKRAALAGPRSVPGARP